MEQIQISGEVFQTAACHLGGSIPVESYHHIGIVIQVSELDAHAIFGGSGRIAQSREPLDRSGLLRAGEIADIGSGGVQPVHILGQPAAQFLPAQFGAPVLVQNIVRVHEVGTDTSRFFLYSVGGIS